MHEIERKFLMLRPAAKIIEEQHQQPRSFNIQQRYLQKAGDWSLRLRRRDEAGAAPKHFLTLKRGITSIKCIEAETLVDQTFHDGLVPECGPAIRKVRHEIHFRGHVWEIDIYQNPELTGIEVAEIELGAENEAFERPSWLGREVTDDKSFKNAAMARRLTA